MSPSEVIIEVYIMPEDASLVLFLSVERLSFITREKKKKKVSSSFSHFVTAGLAGLPGPAVLFPLGQGAMGAVRGNPEQQVCYLLHAGVGPGLARPQPRPPPAWPPRLLSLPPRFYILTKALYRIVLITFRC